MTEPPFVQPSEELRRAFANEARALLKLVSYCGEGEPSLPSVLERLADVIEALDAAAAQVRGNL